jgi:hypothetical protein
MLLIEGAEYGQCIFCLSWRPADESVWNYELLDWVCFEPCSSSALVV